MRNHNAYASHTDSDGIDQFRYTRPSNARHDARQLRWPQPGCLERCSVMTLDARDLLVTRSAQDPKFACP